MMPRSQGHRRPFSPKKHPEQTPSLEGSWGKAAGWRRGIIPVPELSRLPPREAGQLLSVGLVGGHCTAEAVPVAGRARLRDSTHGGGMEGPRGVGRQRDAWGFRGFGGCFGFVFAGKGLLQVPPTTHKPPYQGPSKCRQMHRDVPAWLTDSHAPPSSAARPHPPKTSAPSTARSAGGGLLPSGSHICRNSGTKGGVRGSLI